MILQKKNEMTKIKRTRENIKKKKMKSKKVALCGVHIRLYLCEESTMSENKKGKPKKSEQGSETERVTKRRIGKREREREKGKMVNEEAQAVCVRAEG